MAKKRDGSLPTLSRGYGDIDKLYVDAERWADGAFFGLATRPERDLSKYQCFAELRREPWKLTLAISMAYFARSSDYSRDTWPYDRFLADLTEAKTPLPPGMSISTAVTLVGDDLERLTIPVTPGARAKGTWFEINIARPMSARFSAVTLGAASSDELRAGDSGEVQLPSSYSPPLSSSTSLWLDWLRGRTSDVALEHSVIHVDISRAPEVLSRQLQAYEKRIRRFQRASDRAQDETRVRINRALRSLEWHAKALRTAALFASEVATETQTMDELQTWLRSVSDTREDDGGHVDSGVLSRASPLADAAIKSGQVPADSTEFVHHLASAADAYVGALGLSHAR